jgi:hypothetical protein
MSSESKSHVTIKIPTSLYSALVDAVANGKYPNQTAGIILALERDLADTTTISLQEKDREILKLQETVQKQALDIIKKEQTIQKQASEMSTVQATSEGRLNLCIEKDTRIMDLQKQNEQLKVKDSQIEKLSETIQAQAIHIQSLINQKAVEAPGAKKPWWRFW